MKNRTFKASIIIFPLIIGILITTSCGTPNEHAHDNKNGNEHSNDNHSDHETTHEQNSSSPRKAAMSNVGDSHVHIDYSAPSVKGRKIWGGLVAYDQIWVTGAHKATSINFPNDVMIKDAKVSSGKYALFTIPSKSEWTLILNKNWDQHLADDYDQSLDIVRFKVNPEKIEQLHEQLTFDVKEKGGNTGSVSMSWEKLKISFDFEVL